MVSVQNDFAQNRLDPIRRKVREDGGEGEAGWGSRRHGKGAREEEDLAGRSMGPREMRDMLTMKRSKRHQASLKNWI